MFKIFAALAPRALGDFVAYTVLASSIKELFDDSQLFLYYRPDRPYKEPIVRGVRNAAGIVALPEGQAGVPLDFFDPHFGRPTHNIEYWERNELHQTHLVLAGNMLNEAMLHTIPSITLCPPPESIAPTDSALQACGLDPSKWFATIYWKEDGYAYRNPNMIRTIFKPAPYLETIRHIVENLGGQVVRLGHPTPTELPKLPGVVDLAKVPNSEWLQIYAVARSRFMIASASGPSAYGSAFGVPTVNTDQNLCYGVWGPQDYVVTQIIRHQGKFYRQFEAYDAGLLFTEYTPGSDYAVSRNSVQDIIAAAEEMFKITTDCTGWRVFAPRQIKGPKPNSITLPVPRTYRRELLVPPSQRIV